MFAGAALVLVGGGAVVAGGAAIASAAGGVYLRRKWKKKKHNEGVIQSLELLQQDWVQIRQSPQPSPFYPPWPLPVQEMAVVELSNHVVMRIDTGSNVGVDGLSVFCASLPPSGPPEGTTLPSSNEAFDVHVMDNHLFVVIDLNKMTEDWFTLALRSADAPISSYNPSICIECNGSVLWEQSTDSVLDSIGAYAANSYVVGTFQPAPPEYDENDTELAESSWSFHSIQRPLNTASYAELTLKMTEHLLKPITVHPIHSFFSLEEGLINEEVVTCWFGFDRFNHLRGVYSTSNEFLGATVVPIESRSKMQLGELMKDENICTYYVVAQNSSSSCGSVKYRITSNLDINRRATASEQDLEEEKKHLMVAGDESWIHYKLEGVGAEFQILFTVSTQGSFNIRPFSNPFASDSSFKWTLQPYSYKIEGTSAVECSKQITQLFNLPKCPQIRILIHDIVFNTENAKNVSDHATLKISGELMDQIQKTEVSLGATPWDSKFEWDITPAWVDSPVVTLVVSHSKKGELGITAYDLSSLPLPFVGHLPLYRGELNTGRVRVSVLPGVEYVQEEAPTAL